MTAERARSRYELLFIGGSKDGKLYQINLTREEYKEWSVW